jgi:hypothetical protein
LFFFERLRLEYLPFFIFTRQIITHLMNDALYHHVYRARRVHGAPVVLAPP